MLYLLQGYSWSRLCDTYGISGYCYRGIRGLGCVIPMESVAINTKIKSSICGRGYVYSIQRLVIKFDNDLWQIGSFLQGLRF